MSAKHLPVYRTLSLALRRKHPELRRCNSASEASRIIFGVKSLTHLIHTSIKDRDALLAFFGSDVSGLVEWAKYGRVNKPWRYRNREHSGNDFYAKPEHLKAYRAMVRDFGLATAVGFTNASDFADIANGIVYLKADKKRWARFARDIVSELDKWPLKTRAIMVHDYAIAAEARAHRAATPRKALADMPTTMPTLPGLSRLVEIGKDKFQVLVPRHDADMRAIGRAQHHCVGTAGMGYADQVRRGDIHIIALYKQTLGDGICVELSHGGSYVRQAQGRHRRPPSEVERQAIERLQGELGDMGVAGELSA